MEKVKGTHKCHARSGKKSWWTSDLRGMAVVSGLDEPMCSEPIVGSVPHRCLRKGPEHHHAPLLLCRCVHHHSTSKTGSEAIASLSHSRHCWPLLLKIVDMVDPQLPPILGNSFQCLLPLPILQQRTLQVIAKIWANSCLAQYTSERGTSRACLQTTLFFLLDMGAPWCNWFFEKKVRRPHAEIASLHKLGRGLFWMSNSDCTYICPSKCEGRGWRGIEVRERWFVSKFGATQVGRSTLTIVSFP